MAEKLWENKQYLLAAAAIVLLLTCYELAFKDTIAAWQTNQRLKAQLAQVADMTLQPAYLARKNSNLSKIIGSYVSDTAAFRSNIIGSISSLAEKEHVKLSEVPSQNPLYQAGSFTVQKLGFEGGFIPLLKVLNQLQAQKGIGIVRSVNYRASVQRQNKTIIMEVYLETVSH